MVDYFDRDKVSGRRAVALVTLADGNQGLAEVTITEIVGVSGAVTINVAEADLADLASLGATNVAAYVDATGAAVGTLVALGKGEYIKLEAIRALLAALPLPTGAATQTTLAAVLAKISADPATNTTLGAGFTALLNALAGTLAISAAALPLPTGAASEASLAAIGAKLPALGVKAAASSVSVTPSADQNPIFDHAHGTKTSVTTSAAVITPPAGCDFVRISTDVDVFVNTAGAAAVDDGTSSRIVANVPEVIPVTVGTDVFALSSAGAATVRCTPLKTR